MAAARRGEARQERGGRGGLQRRHLPLILRRPRILPHRQGHYVNVSQILIYVDILKSCPGLGCAAAGADQRAAV